MALAWQTTAVFCVVLGGYICSNTLLQWWYYWRRAAAWKQWKTQPRWDVSVKQTDRMHSWWLPIVAVPRPVDSKRSPSPAPKFRAIPTFNLLMAALMGAATTECVMRGKTRMVFTHATSGGVVVQLGLFIIAMMQQQAMEYYWHRFLHLPPLYKRIHKVHHTFKSPEPFDDMYAHPFENTAYYCILYSPPFLLPLHTWTFVAYMVWVGVCGVLDHSGIRLSLPGVYDTEHHDKHHELFHVNYGFPMPWFDILHGTFRGEFCGRHYAGERHRAAHAKGDAAKLTSPAFIVPLLWCLIALGVYIWACGAITTWVSSSLPPILS